MSIDWRFALAVWWSFFWRSAVYSFIAGFLVGFVIGFVANILNATEEAQIYITIAGFLAYIPASMLAIKQTLQKHLQSLRSAASAAA